MITQIISEHNKEFDEKFPFEIIDWKSGEENYIDVKFNGKMKEIKDFQNSLALKILESLEKELHNRKEYLLNLCKLDKEEWYLAKLRLEEVEIFIKLLQSEKESLKK